MVPKLISILAAISLAAVFPGGGSTGAASTEDGIVVPSFDGEPIVGTLMLPAGASITSPVPVVLRTHGWGGRRLQSPDRLLGMLLEAGYAVFTWDSRGFGHSGGEANWGSPDHEVRDASEVIDYLSTRPEIARDLTGDPQVGWIGASNAGGIQLNTAALDDRVDAIVPQNAWGNLLSDLVPNGVYKRGWGNRLYRRGLVGARSDGLEESNPAGPQEGDFAPEVHSAYVSLNATGRLPAELREWYWTRSTTVRSGEVDAPTLIIHGAIDTLFPLQGALANYRNIRAAGTPVKLLVFCSGHTLRGCPYPGGRSGYPDGGATRTIWEQRIVSWLDRYVKGDASADTGAAVEWQGPDGYYYPAPAFPLGGTRYVTGARFETGVLRGPRGDGGDEIADAGPAPASELGISAIRKRIFVARSRPRPIFGTPRVRVSSTLRGAPAGIVHLELVDVAPNGKRTTVNRQTTPVRVKRGKRERTVRLTAIAWVLRPGHRLELEITTGSALFRRSDRGSYRVSVRVRPRLPIAPARWVSPEARI